MLSRSPKQSFRRNPLRQTVGDIKLTKYAAFIDNIEALGEKHESVSPESMEHFGQNFGFICYHHHLVGKYGGKLYLDGLADRAYVFVNKEYKGVIYRNDKKQCIDLHGLSGENDIDILVEAMGRVNYGPHLLDRKGVDQIRINYQVLSHWDIYTLPLDNIDKLRYTDTKGLDTPTFMRGTFKTTSRGDCFVHTAGLKKGYIFINGFCLGRYWDIGPQESLYIPGTILKDENEIVVLELENSLKTTVRIDDKHNIAGGKKKKFFFF